MPGEVVYVVRWWPSTSLAMAAVKELTELLREEGREQALKKGRRGWRQGAAVCQTNARYIDHSCSVLEAEALVVAVICDHPRVRRKVGWAAATVFFVPV